MFARRVGPWLALAAIVVAAGALAGAELHRVQYLRGADEGYYLKYVTALSESGIRELPTLVTDYLENSEHWIFPSPLRVLYFAFALLFATFFGVSFATLSDLSIASHLALVLVSFFFGRRRLGTVPALALAALTAAAPLGLGLARRALSDSFATLCAALALWMALELADEPGSRRRRIALAIAFGAAILAKESAGLLALPLLALVAAGPRARATTSAAALSLGAGGLGALGVQLLVVGGFERLLGMARILLTSPATNTYALQYGAGPWFRYLVDYMLLSPWVLLLAVAAVGAEFAAPSERCQLVLRLLAFSTALFLVMAILTKNVRYVAILDLPLRVGALVALERLVTGQKKVLLAAGVVVLCLLDGLSFRTLFVTSHIPDPVTRELALARRLIPHRELDQRLGREAMAAGSDAYRKGDHERALAEYEKAARIAPGLVQARANLGSLLLRAGHLDRAAAEYRAALAIDPTLEGVKNGLKAIEERRSRPSTGSSRDARP